MGQGYHAPPEKSLEAGCPRRLLVLGWSIIVTPLGYRPVRYMVVFGRARKKTFSSGEGGTAKP